MRLTKQSGLLHAVFSARGFLRAKFSPERQALPHRHALKKSSTSTPASGRIARSVPSAISREWRGKVIFRPVKGMRQILWLPGPERSKKIQKFATGALLRDI